jgi:hypothetical protein
VAASREGELGLDGKLRAPLEAALVAARTAAQRRDRAGFDRAQAEARGYLNAIFYLSALSVGTLLEGDATPAARQARLAEGWGFWQAVRAGAAVGSSSAAREVESLLSRDPAAPWGAAETARLYEQMNDPGVLGALGIPAGLQVRARPAQ